MPREAPMALNQFGGLTGDIEKGVRQRAVYNAARRSQRKMTSSKKRVIRLLLGLALIGLLYLWMAAVYHILGGEGGHKLYGAVVNSGVEVQDAPRPEWSDGLQNGNGLAPKEVAHWTIRALFDLGVEDPLALVYLLVDEDPLGVSLEDPEEFKCPRSSQDILSQPDLSDGSAQAAFKVGEGFLYFQHLRRAGGTTFCDAAQRNMSQKEVPSYNCMPDNKGSLATPPWGEASYLMGEMTKHGYRIASNEWDAFPASHLQLPGAVFATSIRDPLDRWYSQYRFEHLDNQYPNKEGGGHRTFMQWYERLRQYSMGDNYYVKTFCGEENALPPAETAKEKERREARETANFYWTYDKFRPWKALVKWEQFEAAMKTLRHFNLVLLWDWVGSPSSNQVAESVLGWHEWDAERKDRASKKARDELGKEEWEMLAKANVFDLLFYHWTKRLHLERLHMCR
ncbi:unnamed protein product [Chrysoparadoxa australica]